MYRALDFDEITVEEIDAVDVVAVEEQEDPER